jgi:hypothetical protein
MESRDRNRSVINASDVSRFVYCNRAWWYDRQGYTSINVSEIARGERFHRRLGSFVQAVQIAGIIAIFLILGGVVMVAIYFLQLAGGG